MKISDLVKRTQVSKQTIHYYVREGLVPRPPKFAKNVANYSESYVERIRLIKELQDHHFLPLSLIKRVLKYQKGTPERKPLLQVQTNYFRPVDQLLPADVIGEQDFRKNTGLSRKWLARLEEWGVITPETREDRKVYSQDDVILGRLVVDMGRIGLGPKDGFDAEALKYYGDAFKKVATKSHEYFIQVVLGNVSPLEYSQKSAQATEIMSVFFYHLYRKFARQEANRTLALMESKSKGEE
ncbi:MAG: MerR family transcriptional regulator [Desulfomonilaceae bacterium]